MIVSAFSTFLADLVPLSSKCGESSILFDFLLVVDDLHAENDNSSHSLRIIFHILQEVSKRIGEEIENPFNGVQSPHTISEISRSLENRIIKSTGLLTINKDSSLSTQMEQGVASAESIAPSPDKAETINDETMKLYLDLLTVLLELCPTFTIRLTGVQENGREGGSLAAFAVDAAVKTMTGEDVDTINSAIHFLQCLVSYIFCHMRFVHCLTCKDC